MPGPKTHDISYKLLKKRLSHQTLSSLPNYDDYRIEELQMPTLVFHAKDDKLASYTDTEKAVKRFPNCTFIPFESGGHLIVGHGEEIKEAVSKFIGEQ